MAHTTIECTDLDEAIKLHTSKGYRLDMIMPADAPREAAMSKEGEEIRLLMRKPAHEQGRNSQLPDHALTDVRASATEWITGRAGMMYRDLIPDRLGGKVIASHIRIVDGGEVADSVHYHKIDFQIIYCLKGAIRVVYEDCGEPFWLKPGDCVLQPPEIRHRVLEADAGSEVIEITSPAEHETWFDHELDLPTESVNPDRIFRDQRFVRHIAPENGETSPVRTQIYDASGGKYDVYTLKAVPKAENVVTISDAEAISIEIIINGNGIKAVIQN